MAERLLVLALLVALSSWAAVAHAARPVAAIPVEPRANLSEADISSSLVPLTKVSCGNATVVVYGVGAGKPVVVVVYAENQDWRSSIPRCLEGLRPCLAVLGARVAERLAALLGAAPRPEPPGPEAATATGLRVQAEARTATASAATATPAARIAGAPTAAPGATGGGGKPSTTTTLHREATAPAGAGGQAAERTLLVLAAGAAGAVVAATWAKRSATP